MLPDFNLEGELPVGVHRADWDSFESRFGTATLKRVWLCGRLRTLIELAQNTGMLRRVFVWGSFVTAKPSPGDLDLLLIMDGSFSAQHVDGPAGAVFDFSEAKLRFDADVFWARESIGDGVLQTWLETYQITRGFRKRGIVELELR